VFYDIVSRGGLHEHKDLCELTASGEATQPTVMYRPERIRSIEWLKYNKTDEDLVANFTLITYLPPREFLNIMHSFSTTESNVGEFTLTIGSDNVEFYYKNDKHPDYYTTYDDYTIVFDSYLATQDSTLQKNKTLGYGELGPTFTLSDSFVPDLDEKQFALLLNEAKVLAFAELKQTGHQVAAGNARKQWINMKKNQSVIPTPHFNQLPNYGRRT
jgi:hypothetical protein